MDYIKVSVQTLSEYAEVLADALAEITGGCEVDDPKTLDDFAQTPSTRWDYIEEQLFQNPQRPVTVNFYLADDADGQAVLKAACQRVADIKAAGSEALCGSLDIAITLMGNQDWENSWKAFFKPIEIGRRLLVQPSWEETGDGEDRVMLTIDPASSFGTGSHATTKMCLEKLESMALEGLRLLDIGCGSGILGCAALLLGAEFAAFCDIEDNAARVALENLERNGVDKGQYNISIGDIIACDADYERLAALGPYPVIVANIVTDVLVAMAPRLKALMSEDGVLILSGIIETRESEVRAAYEAQGLCIVQIAHAEGWSMLVVSAAS